MVWLDFNCFNWDSNAVATKVLRNFMILTNSVSISHASSNNDTFIRMVRSEPTFILRLCVIWITFWFIFIDVSRQYQIRYIFSIHYFICSLPTPSCRETCSPDCWPDSDFLSDLSHLFAFVGVVAVVTDVVILRRTNEGWVHPLHPGGHDLTLAPPQQIQSPHG